MAKISTHTLDGTNGSHAAGIPVIFKSCETGKILFATQTDEGGRLTQKVPISELEKSTIYELLFEVENYWIGLGHSNSEIIPQIALRFRINDTDGVFHMPIILSPNSYSTWKSA